MAHSTPAEPPTTEAPAPPTVDKAPSETVKVESQSVDPTTVNGRENGIKDDDPSKENKLTITPLVTEDAAAAPKEQPTSSNGEGTKENINSGQDSEVQSPTEDARADSSDATAEHQNGDATNNVRIADDANPAREDKELKDGRRRIKRSSTLSTIMNAIPGYRPRGHNAPRSGAPRGHNHHNGGCVIF